MHTEFLTTDAARALYGANDAVHDFDHVLRVTNLAIHIGAMEGADVTVVRLAALLHDAPVAEPTGEPVPGVEADTEKVARRQMHHLAAAQFARDYLARRGLSGARLDNVVHSIEAHRFRDQSIRPLSLEAKCLYDADKLDSMGAIGVCRAFAHAGLHSSRLWTEPWQQAANRHARPTGTDYTPVHEFVYKLRQLLDTLHTETARRIGKERHTFMREFFDRLDGEMRSEESAGAAT